MHRPPPSTAGNQETGPAATVTETVIAAVTATVTAEPDPAGQVAVNEEDDTDGAETAAATSDDAATEDEHEADSDDGTIDFGETWEFDAGYAITLSDPVPYTPGEWTMGVDGYEEYVQLEMTFTNDTDEPWDPSGLQVTIQGGGGEGEELWADGFDYYPESNGLPGKTVTYKKAFGVPAAEDIVLQVSPDSWSFDDVEHGYWSS